MILYVSILLVSCGGGSTTPDSPDNNSNGSVPVVTQSDGRDGGLAFGMIEPHLNIAKPWKLGLRYFIGLTEHGSSELIVSAFFAEGLPPEKVNDGDLQFVRIPVGIYDCVAFIFEDHTKQDEPTIVWRYQTPIEVSVTDPHPWVDWPQVRLLGEGPSGDVMLALTVLGDLDTEQQSGLFFGLIPLEDVDLVPWYVAYADYEALVGRRDEENENPHNRSLTDIPAGSYYFGLYKTSVPYTTFSEDEVTVFGETTQPIVISEPELSATGELTVDLDHPTIRAL